MLKESRHSMPITLASVRLMRRVQSFWIPVSIFPAFLNPERSYYSAFIVCVSKSIRKMKDRQSQIPLDTQRSITKTGYFRLEAKNRALSLFHIYLIYLCSQLLHFIPALILHTERLSGRIVPFYRYSAFFCIKKIKHNGSVVFFILCPDTGFQVCKSHFYSIYSH